MIDTKAPPISASMAALPTIPLDRRTALLFNALGVTAAAVAALLPLTVAAYWLTAEPDALAQALHLPAGAIIDLTPVGRIVGLLLSLPAIAALSWGLLRLRVCFAEFGQGRPFAANGIAGLRDFSIGIGLSAIGRPISTVLLSPYLSWGAPAGKRQVVVMLDSDVLLLALFAAIIAALTWAMRKAAAIAEENSQFV
jgi:hypothetical protein